MIAAITLLAACGGGGGGTGGQASSGPLKGRIEYSWWGSTERDRKTEEIIDLFEKEHPGVSVQAEPVGDFTTYWQKLTVEGAAHNAPCVTTTQTHYLAQYDSRGVLMPLDSLVRSGQINISGIPKTLTEGGRGPDGKLYMIPTGAATNAITWNTTYARRAGLPQLTASTTWSQYQSWLIDAVGHLPKGVYATDLQGGQDAMLFAWVLSHGGTVFSRSGQGYRLGFPRSMLVSFWDWWLKLARAGAATPAPMAAEEPASADTSYIATGKVMTEVGSSNFAAEQAPLTAAGDGTLAVTTWPRGTHGNGEVFDVSGLSIGAGCTDTRAAAAFVNFWTNNRRAAGVYESDNGAVTVTSLLRRQIADPKTPTDTREDLSLLSDMTARHAPVFFYPNGYNAVTTDLAADFQLVSFGKDTVDQAATLFFSQANSSLSSGS